jgi:hypothetical protein
VQRFFRVVAGVLVDLEAVAAQALDAGRGFHGVEPHAREQRAQRVDALDHADVRHLAHVAEIGGLDLLKHGALRAEAVVLGVMREPVLAVEVAAALELDEIELERLAAGLEVVDEARLEPDELDEPDGGQVALADVPEGRDGNARRVGDPRDAVLSRRGDDLVGVDRAVEDLLAVPFPDVEVGDRVFGLEVAALGSSTSGTTCYPASRS